MEIRRRPELPYPIVLRYTNEIKAAHYKLTLVKTMGNLTRKQNLQFDLTNMWVGLVPRADCQKDHFSNVYSDSIDHSIS